VQHQPTTTDCQPTLNNGIQVFVTGKLAVQLRPSPRHLPAPTRTLRPRAPPPALPPARAPPHTFYLWLVVLRPAAAGPKAPVASHEAQIPATRAAPRLRSAASASCAAQVDGGTNPLMFSQARAPATCAGRRR